MKSVRVNTLRWVRGLMDQPPLLNAFDRYTSEGSDGVIWIEVIQLIELSLVHSIGYLE